MADDEMINVDDINYAIYRIGEWENDYEINQIDCQMKSLLLKTQSSILNYPWMKSEALNFQYPIKQSTDL